MRKFSCSLYLTVTDFIITFAALVIVISFLCFISNRKIYISLFAFLNLLIKKKTSIVRRELYYFDGFFFRRLE